MKQARLLRIALAFVLAGACIGIRANAAGPVLHGVDTALLLQDVRTLSSPAYAGRKTGTEGSLKAQAYLQGRFESLGLTPYGSAFLQPFSFTRNARGAAPKVEFPAAANLVGYYTGSKYPDRVMVVSAHYDHLGERDGKMYPGADDNASGVGAMLAIAAHFKAHPPENTIVFIAFDAEEQGLQGARAFMGKLPFPREQLVLNLNMDMVSHNDANVIFAAGVGHTPALQPLVEQVAKRSTLQVRLGHDRPSPAAPGDDWTDSSDHGPFHKAGVPFLYFGVEDHADYHAASDTFEHINQGFYDKVAGLLVDMSATLDRNLDALVKPRN